MHILVYFLWNKNYGKKEERLLLKCRLMQSHTVDEIFSIQCDVEKCSYNRKISISRCEQFQKFLNFCVCIVHVCLQSQIERLTSRCNHLCAHTTAHCSLQSRILHADRRRQSQMAVACVVKRRQDRLMIDTWYGLYKPDVSSTRYRSNPSCHLNEMKWKERDKLTF